MEYQVLTKEEASAKMKYAGSAAFKAAVRQRAKDVADSVPYTDWHPDVNAGIRFRLAAAACLPVKDRRSGELKPGETDYILDWQICDSTSTDDGKMFRTKHRQFVPNREYAGSGSKTSRRIRNLLEVAASQPGEEIVLADQENEWKAMLEDLMTMDPPMFFTGRYCEIVDPKNAQYTDRFVKVYDREDDGEEDTEPAEPVSAEPGEATDSVEDPDEAPEYDPGEPAEPVAAEPAPAPRATRKVGRPRRKKVQ